MAENSKKQRRGKPFQKGKSGNPGGRPKEVGEVRELAREHTVEAITTLVNIMHDHEEPGRARAAAAEAILNRGWGKPEQTMEIGVTQRPFERLTDEQLNERIVLLLEKRGTGDAIGGSGPETRH